MPEPTAQDSFNLVKWDMDNQVESHVKTALDKVETFGKSRNYKRLREAGLILLDASFLAGFKDKLTASYLRKLTDKVQAKSRGKK